MFVPPQRRGGSSSVHGCVFTYKHLHIHMCERESACTCVCMCVCVYVYVCMYVCMYIYMCVCECVCVLGIVKKEPSLAWTNEKAQNWIDNSRNVLFLLFSGQISLFRGGLFPPGLLVCSVGKEEASTSPVKPLFPFGGLL